MRCGLQRMPCSKFRLLAITGALLAIILLWDLSGLDLHMARLAGSSSGFYLRDNQLFELVVHTVSPLLSWAVMIGLLVTIG